LDVRLRHDPAARIQLASFSENPANRSERLGTAPIGKFSP
jgi:hypothetical protein